MEFVATDISGNNASCTFSVRITGKNAILLDAFDFFVRLDYFFSLKDFATPTMILLSESLLVSIAHSCRMYSF